jgi:hypothetical protein
LCFISQPFFGLESGTRQVFDLMARLAVGALTRGPLAGLFIPVDASTSKTARVVLLGGRAKDGAKGTEALEQDAQRPPVIGRNPIEAAGTQTSFLPSPERAVIQIE